MKIKQLLLLTKRLYKKAAFIFLLLSIPLTVILLGESAEDEAFMSVGLVMEDPENELCREITDSLLSSSELVRFVSYDSEEKALEGVRYSEIDCAWIFPKDIEARIERFAETQHPDDYIVKAFVGEKTVATHMVGEKLSGVLYRCVSRSYYLNYIREKLPLLDEVSDEELFEYYDSIGRDMQLFKFETVYETRLPESGYLMSPVRGILAIVVVFGAFAGTMYYIEDERRGVFYNFTCKSCQLVEFLAIYLPVVSLTFAVFLSLALSGMSASFFEELYMSLYLSLTATLFAMLMRRVVSSVKALSVIALLLTFVMASVCPVFFDVEMIRPIQVLFPVTQYLDIARGASLGILYLAVLLFLVVVLGLLRKNKGIR